MHETILLAPSANGTELLRTLARHGQNTLCLRVMSAAELAETALMRSGIVYTEQFLRASDAPALISSFLREIPFFASASYADARNIAATLDQVRRLIPAGEAQTICDTLAKGEFSENSAALAKVYQRYLEELRRHGLMDGIQLIRRALSDASPFEAKFLMLEEFPPDPLERALIEKLGKCQTCSFRTLLHVPMVPIGIADMTEAYGAANEIESILQKICQQGIPFDDCTIAVSDPQTYAQLFYALSEQYEIPMTFGCGLSVANSTAAEFLRKYLAWETTGFHGRDALQTLVFSRSFDRRKLLAELGLAYESELRRLTRIAGSLRLSCDRADNESKLKACAEAFPEQAEDLALVGRMFEGFSHSCAYLVEHYCCIREGAVSRLDRSAVSTTIRALDAYTTLSGGQPTDVIPHLLNRAVCRENSREGAVHITDLSHALCCLRGTLFIAGMSADRFPGSPQENYLIPDGDFLLFSPGAPTSEKQIAEKRRILYDLLETASALHTVVHISYAGYDTAELKDNNASSVLFELFRAEHGENAAMSDMKAGMQQVGFFDNAFAPSRLIGKAYLTRTEIIISNPAPAPQSVALQLADSYSPTALELFCKCPRRYYFSRILRMEEPETDNVFTVVPPLDLGNLVHDVLHTAAQEGLSRDETLALAGKCFDAFLKTRPPVNFPEVSRVRDDILQMVGNGYDGSAGCKIILSEFDIEPVSFGSIWLAGRLDRLECAPDGRLSIVDFKTSRQIVHTEDDPISCMQVLLYAEMLKVSQGLEVSGGEYRYLRYNRRIRCSCTQEATDMLRGFTEQFVQAHADGIFPATGNCQYCGYRTICRKEEA